MSEHASKSYPNHFGFLLLNNFTLISMSSAIEPLRMANRICRANRYTWTMISESGEAVFASDGLSINVDCSIDDDKALDALDIVVVCGGTRIEENTTEPTLRWLRAIGQQKGIGLGSICTGSYVLAAAGLLDGYRCSVHWENMAALADLFPKVHVSRNVYTTDRDRFTCSGGTAPVDMMLHFIRKQCGPDVSTGVAEQFIYERIRLASDQQRIPLKHMIGNRSEKLLVAVGLMEANVREPIDAAGIASYTGVSRRQLQRLFQRYLQCTPSRYYLQIRLVRARELLRQTSWSLVEIAALTGFVSSSHFSKSYKDHYGHSPSIERRPAGH
jgi:AraC family transcriptional regulator, glycine betaine-responsive activator